MDALSIMERDKGAQEELIHWLDEEGYFTSPASTKYHNDYSGGLMDHSWNVLELLDYYNASLGLAVPWETVRITALLHDVCKVGLYIGENGNYSVNKAHPKGHGELSLMIVRQFFKLTELEEKMIHYHMGPYGCHEFDEKNGEYPLRGGGLANAWYHFPAVKVMYFCDELASLKEIDAKTS